MAMQLDKNALIPILEAAGFSQSNTNIWMVMKDQTPYAVDFKKNEIFRFEGTDRITTDDNDTYLNEIKDLCVKGTVGNSKQEKEETTAPCEICKTRCTFNTKYEMFLCPACHQKADEHQGIPPAVKVVGWEAYEKQKAAEEGTEEKNEFADSVQDTEDLPDNNNAPEKDKSIDKPAKKPGKQDKTETPLLDLIHKYVGNDVIEVFGETGSGKSKFAMTVAREAIAAGKKVFYLDTERNLTDADIKDLRGCEYKYTPILQEIDDIVRKLPPADVVVIDSIGFPILTSFARMSVKQKGDALLKLIAIFGDLKSWAYKNNGVVVVTNQPESEFNKGPNHVLRPFGDKSQFAAKEIWKTEITDRKPTWTNIHIGAFRSRSVGHRTRIAEMKITSDGVEVKA
jgi:DNA replication protein DnaC